MEGAHSEELRVSSHLINDHGAFKFALCTPAYRYAVLRGANKKNGFLMDLCPLVDAMSILESSWISKGPSTDPEFEAAVAASRIIITRMKPPCHRVRTYGQS